MRTAILILLGALLVACVPVTDANLAGDAVLDNDTVLADYPAQSLPDTPEISPEEMNETGEEPQAEGEETETQSYFTITAVEGDLIELNPEAIDPDNDVVNYKFSEPFSEDGIWQTRIGDEGRHHVAVTATDGKSTTSETILVVVRRANRPPIVECQPITVKEGQIVDLHDHCTISDEDDEEVVVTYGGWMRGWKYQTTHEDAGTHTVVITASDREKNTVLHTVKQNVTITVLDVNRAPVFSDDFPTTITATEQDIITIPTNLISDPDNDRVTVRFSDPVDDKGVWKTRLGDAGTYEVDVVASDGDTTEKRTVTIRLALKNTPPVLKQIPAITVDEGETIELPISASDREGDALTISVSGWMENPTYTTTYDDAGEYTTRVTVSDGTHTVSEVVHITVRDRNRPPVFVTPA